MSRREEILNELSQIDAQLNEINVMEQQELPIQQMPNQGYAVNDAPPSENNMIPIDFNGKQNVIEGELQGARQTQRQMREEIPRITENEERGVFQKISDVFTGNDRETYETRNYPALYESGILTRLPPHQVALLGTMGTLTNDPEEFAEIITSSDPKNEMHYRKDNKGNIILEDMDSGKVAVVDMPGLDSYNMTQFGAQGMLYGVNPIKGSGPLVKEGIKQALLYGAKNIGKNLAKDTAIATGVEGAQTAMGGDFDLGEIGLTAAGATALPAIEEGVALAKNLKRTGPNVNASPESLQGYNQTAQEAQFVQDYGATPLTNFLPSARPQSPYSQQFLEATNFIPVAGTGKMNKQAQAVRKKQVDDYVTRKGKADYEATFESLKNKSKNITDAAGERLNDITSKMQGINVNANSLATEIGQTIMKMVKNTQGKVQKTADKESAKKMLNFYNEVLSDSSFENIKKQRTNFRKNILDGAEGKIPEVEKAINKIYQSMTKSLDDSVLENLGEREFDRWKRANEFWGRNKEEYEQTVLKKIFDKGDVLPTDLEKYLLKGNPSKSDIENLKYLFKNLGASGRDNVRRSYIEWAADKAIDPKTQEVNVNKFKDFLKSKQELTDIFFRNSVHGKHRDELRNLIKFLDMTESAQVDKSLQSIMETRNQIIPLGGIAALGIWHGQIPTTLALLAGVGMAGKAIQSPAVRQKIAELKMMKRGSTEAEKKIEDIRAALQNFYQATVNVDESENNPNSQLGRLDSVI